MTVALMEVDGAGGNTATDRQAVSETSPTLVLPHGRTAADSSVHALRPYQEHLLGVAEKNNVIVVLDTGSGKTRIAQELIWRYRDKAKASGQAAIFLAPTVPLVLQQSQVLEAAGLSVSRHYESATSNLSEAPGDTKGAVVSATNPKRWAYRLANKDVLCMTPEFLVHALMHAHVKMSDISVLVLDEAHHAGSWHPYAVIMQDFYAPACGHSNSLPRVLGLTASPTQLLDMSLLADKLPVPDQHQRMNNGADSEGAMVGGNSGVAATETPKPLAVEEITRSPCSLELILDACLITEHDRDDLEREVPVATACNCEYTAPPWSLHDKVLSISSTKTSQGADPCESAEVAEAAVKLIRRAEQLLNLAAKHSVLRDRIHRQLFFMVGVFGEDLSAEDVAARAAQFSGTDGMFEQVGKSSMYSLLSQLSGVRQVLEELGPWCAVAAFAYGALAPRADDARMGPAWMEARPEDEDDDEDCYGVRNGVGHSVNHGDVGIDGTDVNNEAAAASGPAAHHILPPDADDWNDFDADDDDDLLQLLDDLPPSFVKSLKAADTPLESNTAVLSGLDDDVLSFECNEMLNSVHQLRLLQSEIAHHLDDNGGIRYGPKFSLDKSGLFGGQGNGCKRLEREVQSHALMLTLDALASIVMIDDEEERLKLVRDMDAALRLRGPTHTRWPHLHPLGLTLLNHMPQEVIFDDLTGSITAHTAEWKSKGGFEPLVTNKLQQLLQKLDEHLPQEDANANGGVASFSAVDAHSDHKSAMIFFERKASAIAVNALLRALPRLRDRTKSCAFLGQHNRAGGSNAKLAPMPWSMGWRDQKRAIDRFRRGTYRVLVSTYVGSEGLDFRQCSMVVCADLPNNVASLVQCRGRARKRGSVYVILAKRGCVAHKRALLNLHNDEVAMSTLLLARSRINLDRLARHPSTPLLQGGPLAASLTVVPAIQDDDEDDDNDREEDEDEEEEEEEDEDMEEALEPQCITSDLHCDVDFDFPSDSMDVDGVDVRVGMRRSVAVGPVSITPLPGLEETNGRTTALRPKERIKLVTRRICRNKKGRRGKPNVPLPGSTRPAYLVPFSSARVPMACAQTVVEQFCMQLPGNDGFTMLRPYFLVRQRSGPGENLILYTASLFFPTNCPMRTVEGPPRETKKEAKQTVCLIAVQKLHRMGLLDDHLNPSWSNEVAALGARGKWEGAGSREVNELMQKYPEPPELVGTCRRVMLTQRLPTVLLTPAVPPVQYSIMQPCTAAVRNSEGETNVQMTTMCTALISEVVLPTSQEVDAAMDDTDVLMGGTDDSASLDAACAAACAIFEASHEPSAPSPPHHAPGTSPALAPAPAPAPAPVLATNLVPVTSNGHSVPSHSPCLTSDATLVPLYFYGFLHTLEGSGGPSCAEASAAAPRPFLHHFCVALTSPLPVHEIEPFTVWLPSSECPLDTFHAAHPSAASPTAPSTSALQVQATVRVVALADSLPSGRAPHTTPLTEGCNDGRPTPVLVSELDWKALGACHKVLRAAALGAIARKRLTAIAGDALKGVNNLAKLEAQQRRQQHVRSPAEASRASATAAAAATMTALAESLGRGEQAAARMLGLPALPLPFCEHQPMWDAGDWVRRSGTAQLCSAMVQAGRLPADAAPFSVGVPSVFLRPPKKDKATDLATNGIADKTVDARLSNGPGRLQVEAVEAERKLAEVEPSPWFLTVPLVSAFQQGGLKFMTPHLVSPSPPASPPGQGPQDSNVTSAFIDWDLISNVALGLRPMDPDVHTVQSRTGYHIDSPQLPCLVGSIIVDSCSGRLYCSTEDAASGYGGICTAVGGEDEDVLLHLTIDSPCNNIRYVTFRHSIEMHYPDLTTLAMPLGSPIFLAVRLASLRIKTNILAKGAQRTVAEGAAGPASSTGEGFDAVEGEEGALPDGRVVGVGTGIGGMCEQLIPSLMLHHPLSLAHWRALQQLPSLLYRMEGMLSALQFREQVVKPLGLPPPCVPPVPLLMASLSTRSCCDEGACLELLEFLGDAVLKYVCSMLLHFSLSAEHEGVLSALKSRMVCNEALLTRGMRMPLAELATALIAGGSVPAAAAIKSGRRGRGSAASHPRLETPLQLDTYLRAQPLSNLQFWACRSMLEDTTRLVEVKGKRLADGVESLIGAVFIHVLGSGTSASSPSGASAPDFASVPAAVNAAALLCERIGVLPIDTHKAITEAHVQQKRHSQQQPIPTGRSGPNARSTAAAEQLEGLLGYKFSPAGRSTLQEALTHCSWPQPPCYQRLEFLGDAVLELITTVYLWHSFVTSKETVSSYGEASPGKLTLMRERLVSNARLAQLAARCGIQNFARIGSRSLQSHIRKFCRNRGQSAAALCLLELSHPSAKAGAPHGGQGAVPNAVGYGGGANGVVGGMGSCGLAAILAEGPVAENIALGDSKDAYSGEDDDEDDADDGTGFGAGAGGSDGAVPGQGGAESRRLPPALGSTPKVLSDIFEALLAAVFLDSGCGLGEAYEMYSRLADLAA